MAKATFSTFTHLGATQHSPDSINRFYLTKKGVSSVRMSQCSENRFVIRYRDPRTGKWETKVEKREHSARAKVAEIRREERAARAQEARTLIQSAKNPARTI